LQHLKAAADAVICLPNQKLFKLMDEKTSVLEGFKISNGLLAQGVRGIWQLFAQTGLINVDFADLCSVTRGRHAESSFATAEASGENRAEQVIEKLLAHPLLERGQVLNQSDTVLVSLVGGPDLTMSEVSRLMEELNRQCENAHIILGAAINEQFATRLSATLIASRNQRDEVKLPSPSALESHTRESVTSAANSADTQFLNRLVTPRSPSRFIAPPPTLSDESKEQLFSKQRGSRPRKNAAQKNQRELPLEIVSKGRFEKSEPTVRHGEDLDVPTYVRRGMALN
jgi:cell division protein FtsZ